MYKIVKISQSLKFLDAHRSICLTGVHSNGFNAMVTKYSIEYQWMHPCSVALILVREYSPPPAMMTHGIACVIKYPKMVYVGVGKFTRY